MAFVKYASARVLKAAIGCAEWDGIRARALSPAPDFRQRTAKVLLQEYDPAAFLLSHCTIIASVDTEDGGQPVGRHMVDGFQIDRKYADYFVTSASAKYINNNNDCWERKLLLSCFKTFIGAENYVEHIQIPELSKGKIIDAAARNIGESVYVDILIATSKKHGPLVDAITSGKISTLSMGCSVEWTQCTKCGNVAEDETHLCPHIRYFKGSEFVDDLGSKRKIAELCGHHTDPQSVKFIEASWVANPAFTGAVLRTIVNPTDVQELDKKIQTAFTEVARGPAMSGLAKAARTMTYDFDVLRYAQGDDGQQGQGQDSGPPAPVTAPADADDPLHKAVKDLSDVLRERAVADIRKEIGKDDASRLNGTPENQNDNLIKSAFTHPEWRKIGAALLHTTRDVRMTKTIVAGLVRYKRGGWQALAGDFSGRQMLGISRVIDRMSKRSSMAGEARVYRAVIVVGGIAPYENVETYLAACRQVLGRPLTGAESGALLEKGRIYSLGF